MAGRVDDSEVWTEGAVLHLTVRCDGDGCRGIDLAPGSRQVGERLGHHKPVPVTQVLQSRVVRVQSRNAAASVETKSHAGVASVASRTAQSRSPSLSPIVVWIDRRHQVPAKDVEVVDLADVYQQPTTVLNGWQLVS